MLDAFAASRPEAAELASKFLAFVNEHEDCLLRTCVPGHITASAWILSPDGQDCLLTHHRKLGRWLQLGGHVDGEAILPLAALREAQEESGMREFELLAPHGAVVPLDLDVHPIPARAQEPEHLHWDVRFLLRARPGQALVISHESKDLQWAPRARLREWTDEESVLRLDRAAAAWEAGSAPLAACRWPDPS